MNELNRKVVELLGWRYVTGDAVPKPHQGADEQEGYIKPNGFFHCLHCGSLPEWSEYIDQAMELLEGLEWDLWNTLEPKEYYCSIDAGEENGVMEDGNTPAEAIVKAWIIYQTYKTREGES